jgi:hypothetical protein
LPIINVLCYVYNPSEETPTSASYFSICLSLNAKYCILVILGFYLILLINGIPRHISFILYSLFNYAVLRSVSRQKCDPVLFHAMLFRMCKPIVHNIRGDQKSLRIVDTELQVCSTQRLAAWFFFYINSRDS